MISAALFEALTRNTTAGELRALAPDALQGTVSQRTSVSQLQESNNNVPVPIDTRAEPTGLDFNIQWWQK